MSALIKPRLLRVGFLVAFAAVIAAAAWGYFVSSGSASAVGHVGALSAPSNVNAVSGAGTVTLSWSSVNPPTGTVPVTYYVNATGSGSGTGGTCPMSQSSAANVTSCTISGLTKGSYSYTVTAVWQSWTSASSTANATLNSGAVSQLVFTTQPDGSPTGGVAFPRQPVVTAEDAQGYTVAGYAGTVSLSIASGTSGASLSGCSGTLAGGVTTFAGCKIDKTGTYTLKANDGTLSAVSNSFTVSAGPATQIVFTTQPDGSPTGGVAFPQQPVVTALDAGGNTASGYAGTVSLSIASGTSGASLSGCSGTLAGGVTTFAGCKIDKTGTYTLKANDGTLSAVSNSFTVSAGPATKLMFTTQPDGSPTGGVAFPQQPVVTALDAGGNTASGYAGTVSLSIASGTSGASLSGCSGTLAGGVTTFTGCKIDKTGTYTLKANDGTLNTTSNSFTVSVGPVAQLAFTTQPDGSATGGTAFPNQPVVTAQDAGGNTVTGYTGTVSLTIASGTSGASLSGCSGTLAGGVTTFAGCKIDKTGTYTLKANDGTQNATSAAFMVSAGPATQLVFTTQPDGGAVAGIAFPQQPVVTAYDAGGNVAAGYGGSVSLTIATGTSGATLSGCSGSPTSGVITFTGCKIDKSGTYTLKASDGTLSAVSNSFSVSNVGATMIAEATGPSTQALTVASNLTTDNGQTYLIFVYCSGQSASCNGTPAHVTLNSSAPFGSTKFLGSEAAGTSKDCLEVISAVGNGTSGNVTIQPGSGQAVGFVKLVELTPNAQVQAFTSTPGSGSVSPATAQLSQANPSYGELVPVAVADGTGSTAISVQSPATGMNLLGSAQQSPAVGADLSLYFDTVAQPTASFTLTPGSPTNGWATFAVEVG